MPASHCHPQRRRGRDCQATENSTRDTFWSRVFLLLFFLTLIESFQISGDIEWHTVRALGNCRERLGLIGE